MTYKLICLIFGILPTQCSTYIAKMVHRAAKKLRRHPLSWVNFPDKGKMSEFAAMVEAREPLVGDVIGFMDGVSLPVECTDE